MPQKNDCILTSLGSGDVAGLLLSYYQTNGATSNDLQDAEREFLIAQGVDEEANQDMWNSLLKSLGYSGALPDMLNEFWCIGGGAIVPTYWTTSYDDTGDWNTAYDTHWNETYNTEIP